MVSQGKGKDKDKMRVISWHLGHRVEITTEKVVSDFGFDTLWYILCGSVNCVSFGAI